jgi:hypothetical protein
MLIESPAAPVDQVIGTLLAGNALVTTQIVFSQLVGHVIVAAGTPTSGGYDRTLSSRPGAQSAREEPSDPSGAGKHLPAPEFIVPLPRGAGYVGVK